MLALIEVAEGKVNGQCVDSFRHSDFCVAEYEDGNEEGEGKDDEYVKTEEGSEYVGIDDWQEAGEASGIGKVM